MAEWLKALCLDQSARLGRRATGSNPVLSAINRRTRTDMAKIDKYVSFVKEHVGIQQRLAKKYDDSPYRKGQHLESAKNFADLAQFLTEIQKRGTGDTSYLNRGDSPLKRLHLTYEDIADLSEDQLKELNINDADKQDLVVEHIIAENGGVYSLDKIMVDLFRQTKEFPKRNTITSRLYRMVGKGIIYNVPGKKGVYSTFEMTPDEAKKMFGVDGDSDDAPTGALSEPAPAAAAEPAAGSPPVPKPRPASPFAKKFTGSTSIPRRI